MSQARMTTLLYIFSNYVLTHIFTSFMFMERNYATIQSTCILLLLGRITKWINMECRSIWSVTCKNDKSSYLHFLIMSFDPYFHFIFCLYLSNHLKYFNDTL